MKLVKGDKIKVTVGKDKGKEGTVEKIIPSEHKVVVPGINISKRHMKPRGEGQKGSMVDINRPLAESKVALVCPKCKELTRVGYKFVDNKKTRICRKCQEEI